MNFINLTNGIQAIKDYNLFDYRFIRIQSTACEQKRWEEILLTISDDFLMSVALGKNCIVYDYGANKKIPRAIWQGLEWIKYALSIRWKGVEYRPIGRASSCGPYFLKQYENLDKRTRSRLDYFKPFFNGILDITSITQATDKDGNKKWFSEIIMDGLPRVGAGG